MQSYAEFKQINSKILTYIKIKMSSVAFSNLLKYYIALHYFIFICNVFYFTMLNTI